jgi:hypothetical protein
MDKVEENKVSQEVDFKEIESPEPMPGFKITIVD